MKYLILILLFNIFFFSNVEAQTYEDIYFWNNNEVTTKSKFIEPFYINRHSSVTQFDVKKDLAISYPQSDSFQIKLFKYKKMEGEPGEYNIIHF